MQNPFNDIIVSTAPSGVDLCRTPSSLVKLESPRKELVCKRVISTETTCRTPTRPPQQEVMRESSAAVSAQDVTESPNTIASEGNAPLNIDLVLTQICALEIQNLKIQRCLGHLCIESLNERALQLERQNRSLLDTIRNHNPDIEIHSCSDENNKVGYVNIDFGSDGGLELECFGITEIKHIFRENSSNMKISSKCRPPSFGEHSTHSVEPHRKSIRQSIGAGRFSLANRVSLDWTDKDGARRSFLPPAYDSYVGSQRQSIDIAINSMRLSINQPLQDADINCNFMEFCIVGVKREVLTGLEKPQMGSTQPAAILDNFPRQNQPFIDCIADFAFPAGVFLHMTESKRYAELLCRKRRDQYTVLQFSDSFGTPTYACCLIVTDAIPLHRERHANTIAALSYLERLERCAYVVKRFMRFAVRKCRSMYRREITNKAGAIVGYVSVKPPLSDNTNTDGSCSHGKQVGVIERSKSAKFGATLSKLKDTVQSRLHKDKSPKSPKKTHKYFERALDIMDGDSDVSESLSESNASFSGSVHFNSSGRNSASKLPKRHSGRATVQYVVTQRAYCILSAQPMHSKLFQILEEIAKRESKQCNALMWCNDGIESRFSCESSISSLSAMSWEGCNRPLPSVTEEADSNRLHRLSSGMSSISLAGLCQGPDYGVGGECFTEEHRSCRRKFLEYVQHHPMITGVINKEIRLSFPSYLERKIILPSESVTMEEWASAVVLSIMNPSTIISVLNLLVLEKSLIVFGTNVSMVTAVATAVVGYLAPFTWQGVFVPLVPANAVEILQAPVPFVVGTCCDFELSTVANSAAVLNLDKILDFNEAHSKCDKVLTMPDISVMMPLDQELRATLNNAAKVFSSRLADDKKNLQLSSFLYDISLTEKSILKEVREVIEQHNQMFCGDLVVADGWRKYGTYDPSTGDFDFYPQWFLDHQRSILEFQDSVVHTQLFASYVDKLRNEYIEKNSQRLFLAEWIYFRYLQKKKRNGLIPAHSAVRQRSM